MTLLSLGWDDLFAGHFQPYATSDYFPARVAIAHQDAYVLFTPHGEFNAACTGRLRHDSVERSDLPAVGDWVVARRRPGETQADIHAVLPRRTRFSRRAPGAATAEQMIAANIDTVLLVTALDQNFNLRRIERYLSATWESGAQPVVVLNKADLHASPGTAQAEAESAALGVPVITLSAARAEGLEALNPWLVPGRTLALLGSSGVGKSTLINRLLGREQQQIGPLSDTHGKGLHTTTRRELLVAGAGWLVIDTPGMRELQFWDVAPAALKATFADVSTLASACRFNDCTHRTEPGCAIQAALEDGTLEADRWRSFQKLQREQAYAARQSDARLERAARDLWKKRHRAARQHLRFKEGRE